MCSVRCSECFLNKDISESSEFFREFRVVICLFLTVSYVLEHDDLSRDKSSCSLLYGLIHYCVNVHEFNFMSQELFQIFSNYLE